MDRQMMLKVLVPVGGLAVLVLIVGVVIAVANIERPPPPTPPGPPPPSVYEQSKYTFPLDAPEWKDIGGGLKIWDVKEGTGTPCPTLAEKPNLVPIMHYTGWLLDGYIFDSSKRSGQPLDLPLKKLIDGWKEGVPGMKPGGIRRLYVPGAMGYPNGQGKIPPNADLVFEVELLKVL
jgi:FKBP-type peptidyl-prolyl cis-trans isomerase FkpA